MAEIPENLIFEILLLLPVSSLARFRGVSKHWRDLIDSPDFTRSHSNNYWSDRPLMIFNEKTYPYVVKLNSECNDLPSPILQELPLPAWKGVSDYYSSVGSCNGLLCLRDIDYHGFIIWNPLIGKHLRFQLPQAPKSVSFQSFGFGYDSASDDYKVVTMGQLGHTEPLMVWIYSVKSGSWGKLPDLPQARLLCYSGQELGVFAGGTLYWIVENKRSRIQSIVGLNLGKLEYEVPSLPEECRTRCHIGIRVAAIDGCLCLTRTSYVRNMWVMKEYGVWTSVIRLARDNVSWLHERLTPFAFADNAKAVLFVTPSNQIIRYQHETTSFERLVRYWSTKDLGRPMVFLPTLAWLT